MRCCGRSRGRYRSPRRSPIHPGTRWAPSPAPSNSLPSSPEEIHEIGRALAEAARRASGNVYVEPQVIAPRPAEPPPETLRVLDVGRDFMGENPLWSAEAGRLYWLDILAPALCWFDPATGDAGRRVMNDLFGGLAIGRDGRLILAGRRGIFSHDPASGQMSLLIDPESNRPENRFNTASVDSDGALWAGTMAVDSKSATGALYRVTDALEAQIMLPRIGMPKNAAWSLDGREMYVTEGQARTLYAFECAPVTRRLGKRRVVVEGDERIGVPNGICVDSEGMIWVAMLGGWAVRRYHPDGRLDRVIPLPVPMPTNLVFGGPDLDTLYITSTYIRMPAGYSAVAPQAGRLMSLRPGVRGLPLHRFGVPETAS